jgi:hypothetical protein
MNIRTKKQVEICQKVFNKLNSLIRGTETNDTNVTLIKEYIYNFLQM